MQDLSLPIPSRRLRLGFVGGGRGALVGEWHAQGARMSGRWDIVAGALSSNPVVAQQSGKDWMLDPARSYDDYSVMAEREALMDEGIDAVAICTPNGTHHAIARTFMEAGIDVICDKPMTTTPEDAADLVEAAREYNRFFGVTYTYSFHSMIRQARAMVAGGAIGAVRQAHVEYVQDWATGAMDPDTKQAGWRRNPKHTGRTSVTADIGTHAFHLLSFVLDQPINELSARFHVCGGADNLEDTAFMQLKIGPQDVPGTLWCTQAAAGNACGLRFRIYGDEGGLEWDQEFPEQLHYTPIKQPTRTLFRGKGADILPEAERLIRLPRGHSEGVSDAWCNLYTEMAVAIDARRTGVNLPNGLIQVPDVVDGARGVFFADAAADSHEDNGAWKPCWFEEEA